MASTLGVTGVVTANAGVVVDNITIDGTEIDLSSGDLTIDVAGNLYLDADGELQQLGQKMAYAKEITNYLEKILREINNRNWAIRNTIEWKKFIHGD